MDGWLVEWNVGGASCKDLRNKLWNVLCEIWSIAEPSDMMNLSFCIAFHKVEVRVQLRGQKRRKETLTEAGYYSWQEKIMNGHSFSLFSSSLFLSGHTCQIFVGGNSHQSSVDCFSFHFSRRQGGKQKFFDFKPPKHLHLMPLIKTVQTGRSALQSCVLYLSYCTVCSQTLLQVQRGRKL